MKANPMTSMNMTRRATLAGTVAVAAVAAAPVIAKGETADRSTWTRAVRRLELANSECERIGAAHSAASDAAEAACPYRPEFFKRYGLGRSSDERARERNVQNATFQLCIERGRTIAAAEGAPRKLTQAECVQINKDADAIVAEFDAWCADRDAAHDRFNCDAWERRFDAILDKCHSAREALIATPAPDHGALLVKFQIVAALMEGESGLARVKALEADAQRLAA